jgi:hypothetical protein
MVFVETASDLLPVTDEASAATYRRISRRLQEVGLRDEAAVKRIREIRDALPD